MTDQPRDNNGQFIPIEDVQADGEVEFFISEFECRVIGNRLHSAGKRMERLFDEMSCPFNYDQDCEYWAKKFLNKCSTREKNDEEYYENGKKRHTESSYCVRITMTDYECHSLGNRLWEIGEWFEKKKNCERVAAETQWLARRFHAEKKEQT